MILGHDLSPQKKTLISICLMPPPRAKMCIEECVGGFIGYREGEEVLCDFQN